MMACQGLNNGTMAIYGLASMGGGSKSGITLTRRIREVDGKLSLPLIGALKEKQMGSYSILGRLTHRDLFITPLEGRLRLTSAYTTELTGRLTSRGMLINVLSGGLKVTNTNMYRMTGKAQINPAIIDLLMEDD